MQLAALAMGQERASPNAPSPSTVGPDRPGRHRHDLRARTRPASAGIAARPGTSKGVISYHLGGKDVLINEVDSSTCPSRARPTCPRVAAWSPVAGIPRACITSNLAVMREHRYHLAVIVEIGRNGLSAGGGRCFYGDADIQAAVQALADLLARVQRAGEFRDDFDPQVISVAIRAAIDSALPRLACDPGPDVGHHAQGIANVLDRAARASSNESVRADWVPGAGTERRSPSPRPGWPRTARPGPPATPLP
jgi:hypothetical protein